MNVYNITIYPEICIMYFKYVGSMANHHNQTVHLFIRAHAVYNKGDNNIKIKCRHLHGCICVAGNWPLVIAHKCLLYMEYGNWRCYRNYQIITNW